MEATNSLPSGPGSPGLKVVYANIRSLRNKHDEVSAFVGENQPHLLALTETWLYGDIMDSELHIDGYNLLRADRAGNRR